LAEVKARVLFLEALEQNVLLHFSLSDWVQSLVTLTGACPCFCFLHFAELNVQLIIFNHPKALAWLDHAAKLLAQKGWVAANTHCQLFWLNFDV